MRVCIVDAVFFPLFIMMLMLLYRYVYYVISSLTLHFHGFITVINQLLIMHHYTVIYVFVDVVVFWCICCIRCCLHCLSVVVGVVVVTAVVDVVVGIHDVAVVVVVMSSVLNIMLMLLSVRMLLLLLYPVCIR